MKQVVFVLVLLCLGVLPVQAQERSRWGITGGSVPVWKVTSSVERMTSWVFSETDLDVLKGSEFRIGIARGRTLSGDWGVSFIRKTFDDQDPTTVEEGSGCQGGSVPGGPLILSCEILNLELTPDELQISGVEVNKFISIVTIKERVQIGVNVAGGIGVGQGGFTGRSFRRTFTCTFPLNVFPDFDEDPCQGAVKGPETVTPTGQTSDTFTRLLNYERNLVPLGKIEIAGSVIITPRIKVRIGGGLNYPGMSTIGVTGIYFFGAD